MVILDSIVEALALKLTGKRNDSSRSATGRRDATGSKVIGHLSAVGHRLIKVAVGINAAWHHESVPRINFPLSWAKTGAKRYDLARCNADITALDIRGSSYRATADNQIKVSHV
jgi:hypothetical protein